MFEKILIANRGEIACRVIATARRLGIATVAVYSQADAGARHVALADEAYAIGPAPARQSYLRGDLILAVAHRSRARAIHPGYGFLSENADFAQACEQAGIAFIGPPADAIRAMGSKSAAKTLMERAGVALVPGYHGQDQSLAVLAAAAERIGYPVLLKASAGGGGKGMRIVRTPRDLPEALEGAASEARASFGDDHMLVEKYLTHPRHIEVQVFADTHGNIVSLFERDCSIQRRHQKLLEESPAPTITPAQRSALGQAAIAAARAVAYVGAGTVEFIHQDDAFFFMEMNTRLQVEHPVTEFVTGQDLVEWQLRVAAGERLPLMQDDLALRGHAIEVRICAEDPQRDFMPATGPIAHLRLPEASAALRVDTGIRQGDSITSNYDSMIAKLIVHGQDRAEAVRRLARALSAVQFVGPRTTLDLLRAVAADADFAAGTFDTGFIGSHPELLATAAPPPWLWAAAALAALPDAAAATDPWAVADGWRLNGAPAADILLRHGEATVPIRIERQAGGQWRVGLPGGAIQARLHRSAGADCEASLEIDGARLPVTIVRRGDVLTLIAHGRNTDVTIMDALAPPDAVEHGDANLVAPTPGRVVRVLVAAGAAVLKGQKLLIVESMKVETTFAAPRDGVVDRVHVRPDEMVPEGARLVTFRQG